MISFASMLQQWLKPFEKDTLFVIAAGNDSEGLDPPLSAKWSSPFAYLGLEPSRSFQRAPNFIVVEAVDRTGKRAIKAMLDDLAFVPAHHEDPSFYRDWGDTREFTTGDMGMGECAGEVIPLAQFELSECERGAIQLVVSRAFGCLTHGADFRLECGLGIGAAAVGRRRHRWSCCCAFLAPVECFAPGHIGNSAGSRIAAQL